MSNTAQSAVLAVPLDNLEVLERRLLQLRAELDAILMQLAGRHAARAAVEPAGTTQLEVARAAPPEGSIEWACDEQVEDEAPASPELSLEPRSAHELDASAAADDRAECSSETIAVQAGSEVEVSRDDITALAPIDADPALLLDDADVVADASATVLAEHEGRGQSIDLSFEGDETSIEPAGAETAAAADQAAIGNAVVVPSLSEPAQPAFAEEPLVATAPAADAAHEMGLASSEDPASQGEPRGEAMAAASASAISFEPRQRKQKAGLAAGDAVPPRRGRKVATRIAASIIAMIVAAAALVVADRTALGGSPSRPWASPLPSYQPAWPFLGRQAPAASATEGPAASSEALLGRYREVWPVSP
jgi:hypothetical protein